MKVIVDSQILIQAFYKKSAYMRNLLMFLVQEPEIELVLDEWILKEVEKFQYSKKNKNGPSFAQIRTILETIDFTRTEPPTLEELKAYPTIRDEKDRPILASAIKHEVDILISQDHDFLAESKTIRKLKIMTAQEFLRKYGNFI